jgi:hypothetical protein
MTLKPKNSEGFDKIPQHILLESIEILQTPLTQLFEQVYVQPNVPDQWLVAKSILVYKK